MRSLPKRTLDLQKDVGEPKPDQGGSLLDFREGVAHFKNRGGRCGGGGSQSPRWDGSRKAEGLQRGKGLLPFMTSLTRRAACRYSAGFACNAASYLRED